MSIKITLENVSVQKAEDWLNKFNKTNRSLRQGVVEQYAADMKAGKWTQCVDPIVFYDDGELADGQHRLYAVIESDMTQTFSVMRGLDRASGLNIDTGLGRTVTDNGRISGQDTGLSNNLVAVARAVVTGMASAGRASNAQKLEMVNAVREGAEWAISHMPHAKNVCNSATLGAIARAYYWEADKDRLDRFCKVLGNGFGEGDADTAAIAMRNYMLTNAGYASSTTMWRDTFLKCQNAIDYFMKRKKLTVIKTVKDEAYPLKKRQKVGK